MVDDGASWQAAAETLGVRPDNLRRWRQAGAKQSPDQRVRELEAENKRLRSAVVTMAIELGEATVHGPHDEESEAARLRAALATLGAGERRPEGPLARTRTKLTVRGPAQGPLGFSCLCQEDAAKNCPKSTGHLSEKSTPGSCDVWMDLVKSKRTPIGGRRCCSLTCPPIDSRHRPVTLGHTSVLDLRPSG